MFESLVVVWMYLHQLHNLDNRWTQNCQTTQQNDMRLAQTFDKVNSNLHWECDRGEVYLHCFYPHVRWYLSQVIRVLVVCVSYVKRVWIPLCFEVANNTISNHAENIIRGWNIDIDQDRWWCHHHVTCLTGSCQGERMTSSHSPWFFCLTKLEYWVAS